MKHSTISCPARAADSTWRVGRESPVAMRVGAVSYLNSKPLIEGLGGLAPNIELALDYPSRLADDLADGLLDVALIPSVEYLRGPQAAGSGDPRRAADDGVGRPAPNGFAANGYEIVSDACVATRGPVMSVKLYSRVPPGEIRSLALDAGSRTSAALARIMLEERYGVVPRLEPLPLESSTEATRADAILLIGDRAMHAPRERFAAVWDLGEEWLKWTGLPFVFAVWAGRAGADLGPLPQALCEARDLGLKNVAAIARREAPRVGISEAAALNYLTKNLHFRLGSAERSGLRLFQQLAAKAGLVPAGNGVRTG